MQLLPYVRLAMWRHVGSSVMRNVAAYFRENDATWRSAPRVRHRNRCERSLIVTTAPEDGRRRSCHQRPFNVLAAGTWKVSGGKSHIKKRVGRETCIPTFNATSYEAK